VKASSVEVRDEQTKEKRVRIRTFVRFVSSVLLRVSPLHRGLLLLLLPLMMVSMPERPLRMPHRLPKLVHPPRPVSSLSLFPLAVFFAVGRRGRVVLRARAVAMVRDTVVSDCLRRRSALTHLRRREEVSRGGRGYGRKRQETHRKGSYEGIRSLRRLLDLMVPSRESREETEASGGGGNVHGRREREEKGCESDLLHRSLAQRVIRHYHVHSLYPLVASALCESEERRANMARVMKSTARVGGSFALVRVRRATVSYLSRVSSESQLNWWW
jgi:hypothetical protein